MPRRDSKQNKGTILKTSVDYIRRLRKDLDRLRPYESRCLQLEENAKKLTLRIQVGGSCLLLFHRSSSSSARSERSLSIPSHQLTCECVLIIDVFVVTMVQCLYLCLQELELILRASNLSTNLPPPSLSSSISSPQLTQLLAGLHAHSGSPIGDPSIQHQLPRMVRTVPTVASGTSSETSVSCSYSLESPVAGGALDTQSNSVASLENDCMMMDSE